MYGTLMAFRLKPPQDPNKASELVKKLYGQGTSSHGGRYRCRRKGLLDDIPSRKLIRGVIIVKKGDEEMIVSLLEQYDTEVFIRKVQLNEDDMEALGIK